jgi:hypothetical protein
LQKSQKALPLISRQRTKQATIADQCSLKPVTGIAREFDAWWRGPHVFIRSPHLRVREFESHAGTTGKSSSNPEGMACGQDSESCWRQGASGILRDERQCPS